MEDESLELDVFALLIIGLDCSSLDVKNLGVKNNLDDGMAVEINYQNSLLLGFCGVCHGGHTPVSISNSNELPSSNEQKGELV